MLHMIRRQTHMLTHSALAMTDLEGPALSITATCGQPPSHLHTPTQGRLVWHCMKGIQPCKYKTHSNSCSPTTHASRHSTCMPVMWVMKYVVKGREVILNLDIAQRCPIKKELCLVQMAFQYGYKHELANVLNLKER